VCPCGPVGCVLARVQQVSLWVASYVRARINNFAPSQDRPFVLGLVRLSLSHCPTRTHSH
jgi:hypothetical protein